MGRHAWELNLDWVTPELAVGGRFPRQAVEHLARSLSIRHVVDVRREACDDACVLREHGITLLHLPTEDTCAISRPMLQQGVAWVGEHLGRGHKVYIHCEHGIGRSALLALCVLVELGHAPLEALARAKQVRPRVSPSPAQLEAFIAWCEEWRVQQARPWRTPGFEELAAIAYSHLRPAAG
jgi:protein-tyrosine phosphatase